MTLLKNDGQLLPLSKSTKRIAVIGPNAAVARYGDYEDEKNGQPISILQGIRDLLPGSTVTSDPGSDIPAAVETASQADVAILALGERPGISGEGSDLLLSTCLKIRSNCWRPWLRQGNPSCWFSKMGVRSPSTGPSNTFQPFSKRGIRVSSGARPLPKLCSAITTPPAG